MLPLPLLLLLQLIITTNSGRGGTAAAATAIFAVTASETARKQQQQQQQLVATSTRAPALTTSRLSKQIVVVFEGPVPTKIQDSVQCFSCASRIYEAVWPLVSNVYRRPRNFTDECDIEPVNERRVPVIYCPTICVSMREDITISGRRFSGHVRGCMNDVLVHGFNQSIVSWYRWMKRDGCRQYRRRELMKLAATEEDSTVEVCTCYAEFCNGQPSLASPGRRSSSILLLIVTTILPALLLHSTSSRSGGSSAADVSSLFFVGT